MNTGFFLISAFLVSCSAVAQSGSPPDPPSPYVQFDIWNRSQGGCNGLHTRTLYQTSGTTSNISLGPCEQHVLVSTHLNQGTTQPNIGRINLNNGPAGAVGPVQLYFVPGTPNPDLAPAQIPSGDVQPSAIGNDLRGIDANTTNPTAFFGSVNGSLTGFIDVGQMAYFKALGSIQASVTADTTYNNGGFAAVEGASINANVALTDMSASANSTLTRVLATTGSITGGISAKTVVLARSSGADVTGNITASVRIGEVRAAGAIGNTSGTSVISAPVINIINASGAVRANITATATANNADDSLQRVTGTTFSGTIDVSRVLKLAAQGWTNAVDFSGASSGTLTVRDGVNTPIRFGAGVTGGAISLGVLASSASVVGPLNAPATIASTAAGSSISITGNLPVGQTIEILGDHGGSLSFGGLLSGTLLIGGSQLASGSVITGAPGSPGLPGRIIVNAGAGSGTLDGSVRVGGQSGTELAPLPHYSNLHTELGGGSVGEVPFNLHRLDCAPAEAPDGQPIIVQPEDAPSDTNPMFMRSYGPIVWADMEDPGAPKPYVIRRLALIEGAVEQDVTSYFTQTRDPDDHSVVIIRPADPDPLVTGERFMRGYRYTVSLNIDASKSEPYLKCDLPNGMNPPVSIYPDMVYYICGTTSAALGDADDSGCVVFDDVTTVLNNFGNPVGCFTLGDAERDGDIDFADLTAVLTYWLAPYCGGACSASMGESGADGFTRIGLERDSDAASAAGIITQALALMGYESIEAFANAIRTMTEEDRNSEVRRLGAIVDEIRAGNQ